MKSSYEPSDFGVPERPSACASLVGPLFDEKPPSAAAAAVCNATATIALIPNQSQFEDRVNQFDVRLGGTFRLRGVRLQPSFDLYNVLNASPILARNNTLGAQWGTPTRFMDGRLAKVTLQLDF